MNSGVPPAIRRTTANEARKTELRRHLKDARFHLRNAARSLDAARDYARRKDTDRELAQLDRYASLAHSLLLKIARREIRGLRQLR